MRIALIADIHGNLVALETVLQELAREPVEQIICLAACRRKADLRL